MVLVVYSSPFLPAVLVDLSESPPHFVLAEIQQAAPIIWSGAHNHLHAYTKHNTWVWHIIRDFHGPMAEGFVQCQARPQIAAASSGCVPCTVHLLLLCFCRFSVFSVCQCLPKANFDLVAGFAWFDRLRRFLFRFWGVWMSLAAWVSKELARRCATLCDVVCDVVGAVVACGWVVCSVWLHFVFFGVLSRFWGRNGTPTQKLLKNAGNTQKHKNKLIEEVGKHKYNFLANHKFLW